MPNTKNKVKAERLTSGKERFSYALYFLEQNCFYITIFVFLMTYFTDVGIPALAVAAVTLVVKVWDAVNDPIFGGIVDRVQFKKGKFLPWLRISLVAIPAATIFLFAIPSDISVSAKVIWACAGYILWDMAYTICDVPIFGIVTTMTDKSEERTLLITFGRVAALVAGTLVGMTIPAVRGALGGWFITALAISAAGFLTMIPICFTAKERFHTGPGPEQPEVGVKAMFKYISKNKYMLIFFGALTLYSSAQISQNLGMYGARFLLGNESLMMITTMAGFPPMLIVAAFIPLLTKKFGKYKLMVFAFVTLIVTSIVSYFVGYSNFVAYMVMVMIKNIPVALVAMLMFLFTPDCVEYGQYKSGISAPGITFSIQTFTAKLTAALATSIGALMLSLIGFIEGENAIQPEGFTGRFWFWSTFVPVIGTALALILFRFFDLKDADVQIMADCNNGKITREEAEKLLGNIN